MAKARKKAITKTKKPVAKNAVGNPPGTIEGLRKLALDISRDKAGVSLGAKAHTVLARLVDMPEQSAVRSISELAKLLDTNPSTLTRLSKRLGFKGFSDFQRVFRDGITKSSQHFYSNQFDLLLAEDSSLQEEFDVFNQLARETATNMQGFISQLNPEALSKASRSLARAKRVRIHGVRQFHALASSLTYGLGMIRSDVSLLNAPQLGIAEALAQLEPGDVVVVASCAPYTRSVAEIGNIAAGQGLDVIAITDTRSSPLTASAASAFFIPHASSFFSNSMGAYIMFCEGLLNLVAKELGGKAARALSQREDLIAEMKIET